MILRTAAQSEARLVMRAARVREQRAVVWNWLYRARFLTT